MKRKTATNPAKINLKNVKRFVRGYFRLFLYKIQNSRYIKKVKPDLEVLAEHKQEQFEWRLTQTRKECLKNGACVVCGCDVPALQMEDSACEGNCYPQMMDKPTWEKYKKDNGIIT